MTTSAQLDRGLVSARDAISSGSAYVAVPALLVRLLKSVCMLYLKFQG